MVCSFLETAHHHKETAQSGRSQIWGILGPSIWRFSLQKRSKYPHFEGFPGILGAKIPNFSPAAPLKSYFTLSSAPQARKFWHFGPPKMRFYKGKTVQNRPDFEKNSGRIIKNPPPLVPGQNRPKGGGFLVKYRTDMKPVTCSGKGP